MAHLNVNGLKATKTNFVFHVFSVSKIVFLVSNGFISLNSPSPHICDHVLVRNYCCCYKFMKLFYTIYLCISMFC